MERSARIAKLVLAAVARAARKTDGDLVPSLLPAIRVAVAAELGGTASLYYGTVDPVYYAEIGRRRPLTRADGTPLATEDGKLPANVLYAAVARRRNAGGRLGRWNVLAASTSAAVGRKVSVDETKKLAEKGRVDLETSYVGRGTRAGAEGTREDTSLAIPTDA